MTVPESDFTGFVASNNRTALTMSLVIVFLAAALAALLVRQGLRADRAARLLLDRSRLITRQSAAYASLAAETDLLAEDASRLPPAFTETLADMTDARRVSIWQLLPKSQLLRCADSFDRNSQGHVAGLELHHDEVPQFFAFLQSGTEALVQDAATDRQTAQFHRILMHPFGSRALLIVPIHAHDAVIGAICIEDAAVRDGSRDFVRTVGSMLALRLTGEADRKVEKLQPQQTIAPQAGGERNFSADLALRNLNTPTLAATVYSDVAVMVLRLPDQATLARHGADNDLALADTIACQLQSIAEEQDIPYLKFVGEEAIAAAGFDPADRDAMTRIANLAVTIRDRCSHLLEDADLPADFRIGIDCGLAIGSAVGKVPRLFNLWGDAVRTADIMAGSATPGAIQAAEAAYGRLRQDFLFRPRGSFYLPHVGEARTFVLAGQL
jgi:class 3 adenylate cyclase